MKSLTDAYIENVGVGLLERCDDNFYMFKDLDDAYRNIFNWIFNVTANGKEGHFQEKHTLRERIMNDFNLKHFSTWVAEKGIVLNIQLDFAPKGSLGYFESEKEGSLSLVKSEDKTSIERITDKRKELSLHKMGSTILFILFMFSFIFSSAAPGLIGVVLFCLVCLQVNNDKIEEIQKQIDEEFIQL
jgi:hypothetical protein